MPLGRFHERLLVDVYDVLFHSHTQMKSSSPLLVFSFWSLLSSFCWCVPKSTARESVLPCQSNPVKRKKRRWACNAPLFSIGSRSWIASIFFACLSLNHGSRFQHDPRNQYYFSCKRAHSRGTLHLAKQQPLRTDTAHRSVWTHPYLNN